MVILKRATQRRSHIVVNATSGNPGVIMEEEPSAFLRFEEKSQLRTGMGH